MNEELELILNEYLVLHHCMQKQFENINCN